MNFRLTIFVRRDLVWVLHRSARPDVFQLRHDVVASLDEVPELEEGWVRVRRGPLRVLLQGGGERVEPGGDIGTGGLVWDRYHRCWLAVQELDVYVVSQSSREAGLELGRSEFAGLRICESTCCLAETNGSRTERELPNNQAELRFQNRCR